MRQINLREMQKILKNNGYSPVRTRGSHTIWDNGTNIISIPVVTFKSIIANRLIKENSLIV